MHISKLPSQGTLPHLPDSCWSSLGARNVFLLLLWTAWLMSLRMHCHMGPGVRNGLLGTKETIGPAGRLPASPLNRPVSFHPVARRISTENSVSEGEKHTHTEWMSNSETLRCHHCPGWSHILSQALHVWACDRRHVLIHPHQSEPNGPPDGWCQAVQTHQQGPTNEFPASLPTRAIPRDEIVVHWCDVPDLRDRCCGGCTSLNCKGSVKFLKKICTET